MTDLELAPAAYGDPDVVALTARVQDYYREIYGGPDDAPLAEDELVPPDGGFLLARLDGVAVGMGGWRLAPDQHDGAALRGTRTGELRRMFTAPEARHQGVARALLAELERTARAAGVDAMVLSTGSRQTDAIAFYRSRGYDDIPDFGFWAGWDGVVCLGRRLP